MTDAVVRRAQRGDPAAMEQVVKTLEPYLGRICGGIALERGQDALQETLMIVVRELHRLREARALRGWARRIAVRESVRIGRDDPVVPVDPARMRVPATADVIESVDVRSVLSEMDPHQRAVLVLRHLEGLTEAETARLLSIPVGTVKSRTSRARREFRELWTR